MIIIKQRRPLHYSRGKHNATKYRVFCVLTRAEEQLDPGVCLTTAEIAFIGGIPVANVRRLVGRWVRFKYLHRKGKRGKYVYGLLEKGRRFKGNADVNLPRAREIIAEIIAYQRTIGWIPPKPEPELEPECEPAPEPEPVPAQPTPPTVPRFRTRWHRIRWE